MKADDSTLSQQELAAVEAKARRLLDEADAWGVFPTPIDEIMNAAQLQVSHDRVFDPVAIIGYIKGKTADIGHALKSAMGKVLGIYDSAEKIVHIDGSVVVQKQTFLKLHEAGHHRIPSHRKTFRIFEDSGEELSPEIADLFEREANNFARFALFQGDKCAQMVAETDLNIKALPPLAKKFGASIYATAREFARTNHRECMVVVLNKPEYAQGVGCRASLRRIETSEPFKSRFRMFQIEAVTPDHILGPMLPVGKQRMVAPKGLQLPDKNGDPQNCVAESFFTGHNLIVLIYSESSLNQRAIISPTSLAS